MQPQDPWPTWPGDARQAEPPGRHPPGGYAGGSYLGGEYPPEDYLGGVDRLLPPPPAGVPPRSAPLDGWPDLPSPHGGPPADSQEWAASLGAPPPPPTGRVHARRGPSGRWYAVPAVLMMAAAVLVAGVLVANRSRLETANSGDTVGPNKTGVPLQFVQGYRYQIYRESGTAPKGKPACQIAVKGSSAPARTVTLANASKGYHEERISSAGKDYLFLGDFVAPTGQMGTVRCPGQSATLLVRPDDRPIMILTRTFTISIGLVGSALLAFVALLVLRRRSAHAEPEPPMYGSHWSGY